MKELTTSVNSLMNGMDKRWKQLPVRDSRRIVLYSFTGYIIITLAVLAQVVYQVSTSKSAMEIEHISNTVAKVISDKKKSEIKTASDERD
jgi:uncharacterized membrane protein